MTATETISEIHPEGTLVPSHAHSDRMVETPPVVAEQAVPASGDDKVQSENTALAMMRTSGNLVSFLASLVFHIAMLLVLACWIFTAGKPSHGVLLSADIGDSVQTGLDTLDTFELSAPIETESLEPDPIAPDFSLDVPIDAALPTPELGNVGVGASLASLSADEVIAKLRPASNGRGASFFGAYAEGNRFVYVLDSSSSMDGDRWTYACNQLIDSLNGLKPGQEFFVICFDATTSLLFSVHPNQVEFHAAKKATITRVRRWLRSRTLGPDTMPAEALRFALKLNPDAVFLLSDGELKDNSQFMLRLINSGNSERRQIPIHTVHLFSDQGRRTLEEIALENDGSFTPIEQQKSFGFLRRR